MSLLDILDDISLNYQEILGDKLVGIYIHGSIAFGCFNWDRSDIDFLVVVNDKLSLEEKEFLIRSLIELENIAPQKGLEMSVVLDSVVKPFIYPTPYELHFGREYTEYAKNNLTEYCANMNGVDRDLASHIAVINHVGINLYGEEIDKVFDRIDRKFVLDSNYNDIKDSLTDVKDNPVYYVLNLCRFLAYTKENLILSKRDGGIWAMKNVPTKYKDLIEKAVTSYQSNDDLLANERLDDFVKYMIDVINRR